MGYRSDVGLCLPATAQQNLVVALTEAKKHNSSYVTINSLIGGEPTHIDAESGAVAFLWENLKWCQNFAEIRFVESFLDEIKEEDYLFIRIGESSDDIECRGDFWENPLGMCLSRGIAFAV